MSYARAREIAITDIPVIDVGDLLARWTNDRFKSTPPSDKMKLRVRARARKPPEVLLLEGDLPALPVMLGLLRRARDDDWYHVTDETYVGEPWLQTTCEAQEGYRMEYFDPETGTIYATSPPTRAAAA